MGKGNATLHRAKREKNDEFYTKKKDIENELIHYHKHLKDKIVYCNCDDYRKSKFVEYFVENFEKIGLKKLISTGFSKDGQGTYSEYDGTVFKTGLLSGNGDALGEECTEILKQTDVVVTNCPFSIFRKYVSHLMKYGKKFLIIGNMNAITYKEIFPYIKNNELWLGMNWVKDFVQPNGEVKKFGNICWYTNIPHSRRNTPLDLYKKYSADEYPKYENYDAIEVSKVSEIPINYDNVMGVPITFLDKYCPTQFEIVGCADADVAPTDWKGMSAEFVKTYYAQGNTGSYKEGNRLASYIHNGIAKIPYKRILIRRKKAEPIVEAK